MGETWRWPTSCPNQQRAHFQTFVVFLWSTSLRKAEPFNDPHVVQKTICENFEIYVIGKVYNPSFVDATCILAAGRNPHFRYNSAGEFVTSRHTTVQIQPDVLVMNGVLYIIDQVLSKPEVNEDLVNDTSRVLEVTARLGVGGRWHLWFCRTVCHPCAVPIGLNLPDVEEHGLLRLSKLGTSCRMLFKCVEDWVCRTRARLADRLVCHTTS